MKMIGTESGAVSGVRKDQIDLDIKGIFISGNKASGSTSDWV